MLKFRITNSTKARRAAEAQRRALEEQLNMEWAWKPMASVMNESKTDLLYWVPPLYSANVRRKSSTGSLIVRNRSPSITSTIPCRRKKLGTSRRRNPVSTNDLSQNEDEVEDDDEDMSEYLERDFECSTDQENDRESSIYEESLHEASNKTSPVPKIKVSGPKNELVAAKDQPEKKHMRNIMKLLEKFSHLQCMPMKAHFDFKRPALKEKSQAKLKPNRPSVKIYRTSSNRSLRRHSETQTSSYNMGPQIANSQLEMMLRILAKLYQEKIIRQETDIEMLKKKTKTQEKLIKQMGKAVIALQNSYKRLRNDQLLCRDDDEMSTFTESSNNTYDSNTNTLCIEVIN